MTIRSCVILAITLVKARQALKGLWHPRGAKDVASTSVGDLLLLWQIKNGRFNVVCNRRRCNLSVFVSELWKDFSTDRRTPDPISMCTAWLAGELSPWMAFIHHFRFSSLSFKVRLRTLNYGSGKQARLWGAPELDPAGTTGRQSLTAGSPLQYGKCACRVSYQIPTETNTDSGTYTASVAPSLVV